MQAGRELDALVAEKVMGIVRDPSRCERCGWPLEKTATAGCVVDNCSMRPLPELRGPAPYSTSIDAAWQVVEKMRTRAFVSISDANGYTVINGKPDKIWICHIDNLDGDHLSHIEGESDTAPLAICLAALKASGVEVG